MQAYEDGPKCRKRTLICKRMMGRWLPHVSCHKFVKGLISRSHMSLSKKALKHFFLLEWTDVLCMHAAFWLFRGIYAYLLKKILKHVRSTTVSTRTRPFGRIYSGHNVGLTYKFFLVETHVQACGNGHAPYPYMRNYKETDWRANLEIGIAITGDYSLSIISTLYYILLKETTLLIS